MSRTKTVAARFPEKHKAFDQPYILTMGLTDGTPFVRYQLLPASMGDGHRVELVWHCVNVNHSCPPLRVISGHFHCINCGLMGTRETFTEYHCS
jgi:hypothetical protein